MRRSCIFLHLLPFDSCIFLHLLPFDKSLSRAHHEHRLQPWFVKDHYLMHQSRFAFTVFHGPIHDALPLAVASAGHVGPIEGFFRHGHFSLGADSSALCAPLMSGGLITSQIVKEMQRHQSVPGVFPYCTSKVHNCEHRIEHNFGALHPLGHGVDSRIAESWANRHSVFREKIQQNLESGSSSLETWQLNSNWLEKSVFGYREDSEFWQWWVEEVKKIEVSSANEVKRTN